VDSERKRLTLCIVMRAVGDEEIMMMGYMVPEKAGLRISDENTWGPLTRFLQCSLWVCRVWSVFEDMHVWEGTDLMKTPRMERGPLVYYLSIS
jgi:hypothetical protein